MLFIDYLLLFIAVVYTGVTVYEDPCSLVRYNTNGAQLTSIDVINEDYDEIVNIPCKVTLLNLFISLFFCLFA